MRGALEHPLIAFLLQRLEAGAITLARLVLRVVQVVIRLSVPRLVSRTIQERRCLIYGMYSPVDSTFVHETDFEDEFSTEIDSTPIAVDVS